MASTTDSDEPELLLKTDRLGRVRMPREKREQILKRFESAKRHGLEPYAYIRYLLETLPSTTNWNLHKLAPATYAKSESKAAA